MTQRGCKATLNSSDLVAQSQAIIARSRQLRAQCRELQAKSQRLLAFDAKSAAQRHTTDSDPLPVLLPE